MSQPATNLPPKRRVLYIRHKKKHDIPEALRLNHDEWSETMALLADVTLMTEDFDLAEVCDKIQPDFILYESPGIVPLPLNITNPLARPEIPRLGLQMQDPHDTARVFFERQIERLNIKWVFTHLIEASLLQSPELNGRMYSVSLLFDEKMFRDYGLTKDIPISVFGGVMSPEIYKWRAENVRKLIEYFPTMIYTHPGYDLPVPRHRFAVMGEDYARTLNRSHFSLADSTRLEYVVRKHLEIPATGVVLIAPDSPILKPYGFKDMENCILGTGMDLYNKIAVVADTPELYEKIRKNGHDLVHSRFSRKNWRGILDFYECLCALKPGETIQQQGILGPFEAVQGDSETIPAIATELQDNAFSSRMKTAQHLILTGGSLAEAQDVLKETTLWISHMVESWILLGLIALLSGNLAGARKMFLLPRETRKRRDELDDYDPIEIAWLSLTGALTGDSELLALTRREAAAMRHLSLRRIDWLGKVLANGGDVSNPPPEVLHRLSGDRLSTHWMGQISLAEWLSLIARILAANGQGGLLKF